MTISRIEPGEALPFGAGFQRLGKGLIGQLNICLIHLMVKRRSVDRGAASEAEQEEWLADNASWLPLLAKTVVEQRPLLLIGKHLLAIIDRAITS